MKKELNYDQDVAELMTNYQIIIDETSRLSSNSIVL